MKKVGTSIYFHKNYIPKEYKLLVEIAKKLIPKDFKYTIIKIDKKTYAVTFVECRDFNRVNEPIVGISYRVCDGKVKLRKPGKNKQIYHSKELFVEEDYKGFNIEKAKERTKLWNSIKGLDKSKIGYLNYWIEVLYDNNINL